LKAQCVVTGREDFHQTAGCYSKETFGCYFNRKSHVSLRFALKNALQISTSHGIHVRILEEAPFLLELLQKWPVRDRSQQVFQSFEGMAIVVNHMESRICCLAG
jgi:hypothetical protein